MDLNRGMPPSSALPSKRSRGLRTGVAAVGFVLALAAVGLLAYRLVSGRSLGLRSAISNAGHSVSRTILAVVNSRSVTRSSHGRYTNVVFLHQSVGRNLIAQGGVREILAAEGYSFWDQDYSVHGLLGPDGLPEGFGYNVPDDNTNPDGLARIFGQPEYGLPWNTLSGLLQHEVIIFKSCFPASNITDDAHLRAYQEDYALIRAVMGKHPDKLFIVVTPPPLNPIETDFDTARRARAFSEWMQSSAFLQGHANVITFDLFGSLAEPDGPSPDANMLRQEYREGTDSHPNALANQIVGRLFAEFILTSTSEYASVEANGPSISAE
jgi:hypothetical protein